MLAPRLSARLPRRHKSARPAADGEPHSDTRLGPCHNRQSSLKPASQRSGHGGAGRMLLDVLLPIGLLIVVAKLMEGALNRFGLSSIIAYTLAGAALGPATGIVESTRYLELFLELGIFVLFFIVGLDEIDVPGFVATMRGRYFAAAIISCATTSCPACAAPLRVSSSPCSSPRPDSISTFPSRACRPQRLRCSCWSRWRASSSAPSSEPTSHRSTHRSRSRPGSCPRASRRSPSCS